VKLDEKWRPRSLSECVGNDYNIARLVTFVKKGEFPHFIFHGPPGCGKTTAAKALVNDYYGKELLGVMPVTIVNAADERGIEKIRELRESLSYKPADPTKLRVVIMDEADGLTKDAMFALKALMEVPAIAKHVRFIFTLNDKNHLIEPIHSRCKLMYFAPWSDADLFKLAKKITRGEKIVISDDDLKTVVQFCKGDARRLIVEYLEDFRLLEKVDEVAMRPFLEESTVAAAVVGAMSKVEDKLERVEVGMQIYEQVRKQKVLNVASFIEHVLRLKGPGAIKACAEVDHRLATGGNEYIQVLWLLSELD